MKLNLNFQSADIKKNQVIDGKLHLRLDWGKSGVSHTIISKTSTGYNYEDVGYIKRHFTSLDNMMWEFELNSYLYDCIESLPITDKPFKLETTEKFSKGLENEVSSIMGVIKRGSNLTPKKKKRK